MNERRKTSALLLGAGLLILISCGKSSERNSDEGRILLATAEGSYEASIVALNSHYSHAFGTAKIQLLGSKIRVTVQMNGVDPLIHHVQEIKDGALCPENSADLNNDSYIDNNEATKIFGKTLIPLDGDLSSQQKGLYWSPTAKKDGTYRYENSAYLNHVLEDLWLADGNELDEIIKLENHEPLNFEGKPIVIYGISPRVILPQSVATKRGEAPEASLPIACGLFRSASTTLPPPEIDLPIPEVPRLPNDDREQVPELETPPANVPEVPAPPVIIPEERPAPTPPPVEPLPPIPSDPTDDAHDDELPDDVVGGDIPPPRENYGEDF